MTGTEAFSSLSILNLARSGHKSPESPQVTDVEPVAENKETGNFKFSIVLLVIKLVVKESGF